MSDKKENPQVQGNGYPPTEAQTPETQPGYPQSSVQPGYPQSGVQPGYPQSGVQPGYPQSGVQPGYPQSGAQPGYPQSGVQPGYPQSGVQPGYPQSGVQPGYPQSGVQPGYPQSGVQPGYPQSGVQPGYPQSGVQPGYPQSGVQPGYPQSGIPSGYPQSGYRNLQRPVKKKTPMWQIALIALLVVAIVGLAAFLILYLQPAQSPQLMTGLLSYTAYEKYEVDVRHLVIDGEEISLAQKMMNIDDLSFVSLYEFSKIFGYSTVLDVGNKQATISKDSTSAVFSDNIATAILTEGSSESQVHLLKEPMIFDNYQIYVPLRSMKNVFHFESVDWNGNDQTILVTTDGVTVPVSIEERANVTNTVINNMPQPPGPPPQGGMMPPQGGGMMPPQGGGMMPQQGDTSQPNAAPQQGDTSQPNAAPQQGDFSQPNAAPQPSDTPQQGDFSQPNAAPQPSDTPQQSDFSQPNAAPQQP